MSELSGINLAMQTPLHADGSVDYRRWEELIDVYIDAGVHGLLLGSGTGQHPYLTRDECNRLYELGAKRIGGRSKLICQTSALVQEEVIERSKHAESLGADALMILPPYLEGPDDDDEILAFYAAIDAAIDTDIVGYNIPQATGISISVDLLDRLNQLEHFNYIKDSAGDMTTLQEYLANDHNVLNGCDPNTVFALVAGAKGCIWGAANYMPRESVQLYDLVVKNDIAAAMSLWSRMIPSLLDIWRGNYIPKIKAACRRRGFDGGGVRVPLQEITADEEQALASSLAPLD